MDDITEWLAGIDLACRQREWQPIRLADFGASFYRGWSEGWKARREMEERR